MYKILLDRKGAVWDLLDILLDRIQKKEIPHKNFRFYERFWSE